MTKALTIGVLVFAVAIAAPLVALVLLTTSAAAVAAACSNPSLPTGAWRPPFEQAYVRTSGFGARPDPVTGVVRGHAGQDLASLPGPGSVVAASAGVVTLGSDPGGYGTYVTIDHGGGITSLYGHLAHTAPGLRTGQVVRIGEQLGVEGSTGYSTGPHLHFEIRVAGAPVDPGPFMLEHGAPLTGHPIAPRPPADRILLDPGQRQGGLGFDLPAPGPERLASLTNPPLPIPGHVETLYREAAAAYHLPWTLLAGVGMEETGHGRHNTTSSAGAQGLMQFMPATWATYGVDGDRDGRADIHSDADSVYSAANYLTQLGVTNGPAGVRKALYGYNHATWYVDDVLHYAHAYGGGLVEGDPTDCGPGGQGNPDLPPLGNARIAAMLTWAQSRRGDPYVFGANGPDAWDCSSFVQAAYVRAGVTMPRTATAQRNWLAAGNGQRVPPGQEQPGDLIFIDSYLGPTQIGHVMIVLDPTRHLTIEAGSPVGNYDYSRWRNNPIYEVWRVGG